MSLTLDQVFIPVCQQMLGSVSGVLKKAQAYASENNITESEIINSRLIDTMWPLPNQIQSLWAHSAYAIDQVKSGEFRPNIKNIPKNWDDMHSMITTCLSEINALEDGELEDIAQNDVFFVVNDLPRFKFTVQNFLLSFSMPNIHFHATTAYDILRMKGVDLGKFDFLGNFRNDPL